MEQNNTGTQTVICDACQTEVSKTESRLMSIKMCCKVERVPLCRDCWEKYAKKN